MYTVRSYNNISPKGLQRFPDWICCSEKETDPDALLLRSHSLTPEEITPNVLAVARAGAGVNNIPIPECTKRGIVVFNTPGANANSVKELALCAILFSSRKLLQSVEWVRGLDKDQLSSQVESGKKMFAGPEIAGKTLGIIGLGAIGTLLANSADALGMKVIGYDPFLSVYSALKLPKSIALYDNLKEVCEKADYISLHIPVSPKTKGLINSEVLEKVKPGARLINFAREGLVDPEAVLKALNDKKLSYYISDFPTPALHRVEGAVSFPHLGASTPEAEENCAVMACVQLKDFFENGNITNSVNFPHCGLEREAPYRLCFSHRNTPNMLGQISGILAEVNLNIQDMTNHHHQDLAYTLLDLNDMPKKEILEKLNGIQGMFRVRVLSPH